MTEHELNQVRNRCHTTLPGHKQPSAAEDFAAISAYCKAHHVDHDTYGDGEFIHSFEHKIATLTGFESGVFCTTGTLAQSVALRLATMERGSPLVGMHASAHVLKHENSNYQMLDHFKTVLIGDPVRIWGAADLEQIPDRLGAVLLELPMREIGGQLPDWHELQHIKKVCQERHIHLHLDGARLWEAQASYDRALVEITNGFHSVYVSFYKGIGALGGAMLLGTKEFTARAKAWMQRMGGNVYHRSPYVISAAMQFDQRLSAMPDCLVRARQVAKLIERFPTMQTNPAMPQANLFHLYLPVSAKAAIEARNRIAQQHGIWLFNRASNAALPDQSYVEWYVGDNLLNLSDQQVLHALTLLEKEFSK